MIAACTNAGYGPMTPVRSFEMSPASASCRAPKCVKLTKTLQSVALARAGDVRDATIDVAGTGTVSLRDSAKPFEAPLSHSFLFVNVVAIHGAVGLSYVPGLKLTFSRRAPAGTLRLAALDHGEWTTVGRTGVRKGKDVTFKADRLRTPISVAAYATFELGAYTGDILPATPPPTLSRVSPNSAIRGTTTLVTLRGTNFTTTGTTVNVSGNVLVTNVKVTSSTEITADFLGGTSAVNGAHNVTVTTPDGTSNAQSFTINPGSTKFIFTGRSQTFVVPAGVTQLTITAAGAQGGAGGAGGVAGDGGKTMATVDVTPGQVLTILVGGAGTAGNSLGTSGAGGFNGGGSGGGALDFAGGGGGGASSAIAGGTPLVVGGGGGGGGSENGGPGGCSTVATSCTGTSGSGSGGGGATQSTVGSGGFGGSGGGGAGGDGSGTNGGMGGDGNGLNFPAGGGGGGGGYFGGGGGGGTGTMPYTTETAGGGGGGSSYAESSATNPTFTIGAQTGNGQIEITW